MGGLDPPIHRTTCAVSTAMPILAPPFERHAVRAKGLARSYDFRLPDFRPRIADNGLMEGRHLMTNHTPKRALPLTPHPDHLRKKSKARLASLKGRMPSIKLTQVQPTLARKYALANWGVLQA